LLLLDAFCLRALVVESRSPVCVFATPSSTATYTLSLHDALPISRLHVLGDDLGRLAAERRLERRVEGPHQRLDRQRHRLDAEVRDRKSTRLNSSHVEISYAVFCLKKKTHPSAISPVVRLCSVFRL